MTATWTGEIEVQHDTRPELGHVARVRISNAAKLNVLNTALMQHFAETVEGLAIHADLRAVVLAGAGGRAFVGGADVNEMADLRDGTQATRFITALHRCCKAVRDLPVPVIARIDGYALGAGLELAAACDLRIASTDASFGMPEVLVGIPSVIEAALLPGLIGWGRARRLLLLGEMIGAEDALAWGLVERVVPPAALDAAVEEWLHRIAVAGPRAIRAQKKLIRAWEDLPMREAIAAGVSAFADAWSTSEPRRMMRAFLGRSRPPPPG